MSALILLIALILALVAGYFFLQWKCPNKKDKTQQTMANISEAGKDLDASELASAQDIKKFKDEIQQELKKIKELQKKKSEELSEEENQALANLPVLQEVQTLTQDIQKAEDWNKKVVGTGDYVMAGGVVVSVFLLSVWLVGKLFGLTKLGEAK